MVELKITRKGAREGKEFEVSVVNDRMQKVVVGITRDEAVAFSRLILQEAGLPYWIASIGGEK